MSTGPSMALGGLGSAWSLKVAAVWTNLPVSPVTPSVSLGMWEDSAHPSSCHTVPGLSFFFLQKAFVSLLQKKRLASYLEHPEWVTVFFPPRIPSHTAFPPLFKKVSRVGLYLCSLTCLFSKLFFSVGSRTVLKRKMKSRRSPSYWLVIKPFKQL